MSSLCVIFLRLRNLVTHLYKTEGSGSQDIRGKAEIPVYWNLHAGISVFPILDIFKDEISFIDWGFKCPAFLSIKEPSHTSLHSCYLGHADPFYISRDKSDKAFISNNNIHCISKVEKRSEN